MVSQHDCGKRQAIDRTTRAAKPGGSGDQLKVTPSLRLLFLSSIRVRLDLLIQHAYELLEQIDILRPRDDGRFLENAAAALKFLDVMFHALTRQWPAGALQRQKLIHLHWRQFARPLWIILHPFQ